MKSKVRAHVHGSRSARELTTDSWSDFERLFAANNGVWGGCWCMFYHGQPGYDAKHYDTNKAAKHALVKQGHTHGTIVYCGTNPVGWSQFGPKEELPRVDSKKGYKPAAPNAWRITCFFISRGHRKMGFADLAIEKSVQSMKMLGVKNIEAYPVEGKLSSSLLWSGTPDLFERAGFTRVSRLGKSSWVYLLKTRAIS